MSLFSFNWWKSLVSSYKVKRLPYAFSDDMRRNYDVIETKMIHAMKNHETFCIVYIPYGNGSTNDLLHLSLNLRHYNARGRYPKMIENITLDVPDTLSNQSIITVVIQW